MSDRTDLDRLRGQVTCLAWWLAALWVVVVAGVAVAAAWAMGYGA